jgi:hypothetical protein
MSFIIIYSRPVSPVCARIWPDSGQIWPDSGQIPGQIWPDPGQIGPESGQILARIILKIFLMLLIINCDLI